MTQRKVEEIKLYLLFFHQFRGISSVVRRCIDKETGREYAAKIIDIGASDSSDPKQMLDATRQEIAILRQVMGHPYLSKLLIVAMTNNCATFNHYYYIFS